MMTMTVVMTMVTNGDNVIQSPALMIDLAPTLLHIAGLEDQGIEVFVINHYQTLQSLWSLWINVDDVVEDFFRVEVVGVVFGYIVGVVGVSE